MFKKAISIILTAVLIFTVGAPALSGFAATGNPDEVKSSLSFASISDVHYYPQSYTGDNCPEWQNYNTMSSKEFMESDAITRTTLDSIALKAPELGTKYLFISGDLTKDGEYQAHAELAAILEQFEKDAGIKVIVINGNHDVDNSNACTFENGVQEQARSITQAEFKEVYKNLGYDLAVAEYTPPSGKTENGLSYVVDLDKNYRLIVVDSNEYDAYTPQTPITNGAITEDCLNWVKEMAAQGKAQGKTVMVMQHHSLSAHMKVEPSIGGRFVVDDYLNVAEQYADAGIHFAFTGHLHTNDVASVTSDNGNVIYDCETGSLAGYPNRFNEMKITTYGDGESDVSYDSFDCDLAHEINVNGTVYPKPFSQPSFAINFGGRYTEDGNPDVTEFFTGFFQRYVVRYAKQIRDAGGIKAFLKSEAGVDLDEKIKDLLAPYIGDGINILGVNFSSENIMWFIDDLLLQIEDLYIKDESKLLPVVRNLVSKLAGCVISDVPCTKFIDSLHFGDPNKPGTFGDLVLTAMHYWYDGNEDSGGDAFVQDAIKNFREGDAADKLFNVLVDALLNDVITDAVLAKVEVRVDKLFDKDPGLGKLLGVSLDTFVKRLLKNDNTYKGLVDTIFKSGILPYENLYDVIDQLFLQEYLTDSQMEGIGYELAYIVEDLTSDENPKTLGDRGVTYSSDKVVPPATTENYRLPTMISVTLGENNTSANINWFSKSTVKGGDIEIYKESDFKGFTGSPTKNASFTINSESKEVDRRYPGLDFGVIGAFNYDFKMTRHTVTLSNLEPNTKYFYRVGDASRGWWSDSGAIETPDGGKNVTFFHMSDPQSQNVPQYERSWANVVKTAYKLYPDAKFIMNTGDLVDHGSNTNQWQWMFDTASQNLMNTYFMPATGNHEEKYDYATVDNFTLPGVPEQDTASGVYYSFDYNNLHIAVLNTNDLGDDDAISAKQIEWLKNDMNSSAAQWKIVALHKAPYSNGSHYNDDDVCAIRDQLSVLMPQLHIDLVLEGHDHVYMRTYSMDSNLVNDSSRIYLNHDGKKYKTDVAPTGTTYVISGTSGVKTYNVKDASLTDEYFPRAEAIRTADASMFSAIQIEDGVLYFDAYKVNGSKAENVDSFAIQKDATQGEYAGDAPDVVGEEINNPKKSFFEVWKEIMSFLERVMYIISRICLLLAG